MISKDTITKEWIHAVSAQNNNADRILVEKVIRALLLLEGLSSTKMPFIFKGGTAVMLLQGAPRRFSIDIDIIIPATMDFDTAFNSFLADKGFTRCEARQRAVSTGIEKYHYKFFYNPVYTEGAREDSILLDILVEQSHYRKVQLHSIESPFVKQEGKPATVHIPCPEDILGDKLTAYAPNTTGVPYIKNGQSASMEIIKQLYDIGNLFNDIADISIVAQTFQKIAKVEMLYRSIDGNADLVLNDIIQTSMCIATRGLSGMGDFTALQAGISQLSHYIYSERFQIEKAIVFSSRAAYCAMLIKTGSTEIKRYESPAQVAELTIESPFETRLNKLKKTNPEAFYYWYQVYLLP